MTRRPACLGLALATILAGLALRLGPWRLPLAVHHYGGGVLWGMMLLALTAAFRPRWSGLPFCLVVGGTAATLIEFTRLINSPGLNGFRRTLPGQLLLGQIFSAWNLLAYALGIAIMAVVLRRDVLRRPHDAEDPGPVA